MWWRGGSRDFTGITSESESVFARALAHHAARPYRGVDPVAWHFARSKLTWDPAFTAVLREGLIPAGARILDLGCGQGLLAAWLAAAQAAYEAGQWPTTWMPPPDRWLVHGIDRDHRRIDRARRACLPRAVFTQEDITQTAFDSCDVVVILDVLHYVDEAAQAAIVHRSRDALAQGGVLLLRVGDNSQGLRFAISQGVDWCVAAWCTGRWPRLASRPLLKWQRLLEAAGLTVEVCPMSGRLALANVLLVGRVPAR